MAPKNTSRSARDSARQAGLNALPPSLLSSIEEFGAIAAELAHAQAKVDELTARFEKAINEAKRNGWTVQQLTETRDRLVAELDLPATPAMPRTRKPRTNKTDMPATPTEKTSQSSDVSVASSSWPSAASYATAGE